MVLCEHGLSKIQNLCRKHHVLLRCLCCNAIFQHKCLITIYCNVIATGSPSFPCLGHVWYAPPGHTIIAGFKIGFGINGSGIVRSVVSSTSSLFSHNFNVSIFSVASFLSYMLFVLYYLLCIFFNPALMHFCLFIVIDSNQKIFLL